MSVFVNNYAECAVGVDNGVKAVSTEVRYIFAEGCGRSAGDDFGQVSAVSGLEVINVTYVTAVDSSVEACAGLKIDAADVTAEV